MPVYFGQYLRAYYLWKDGESEPIQIRVENVLELGRARTWDFPLNKKEGPDAVSNRAMMKDVINKQTSHLSKKYVCKVTRKKGLDSPDFALTKFKAL